MEKEGGFDLSNVKFFVRNCFLPTVKPMQYGKDKDKNKEDRIDIYVDPLISSVGDVYLSSPYMLY